MAGGLFHGISALLRFIDRNRGIIIRLRGFRLSPLLQLLGVLGGEVGRFLLGLLVLRFLLRGLLLGLQLGVYLLVRIIEESIEKIALIAVIRTLLLIKIIALRLIV